MSNKTLVAWVGATDLASMGSDLGGAVEKSVTKAIHRPIRPSDDGGPIRTLLSSAEFDSIHLLNTYPKSLDAKLAKWLTQKVTFHRPAHLEGPTDYSSIFLSVDDFLCSLYADSSTRPTELCIHLSPGTPAMTAIWVLLGKSKYRATFYQSYRGKSSVTEIPFDLDLHIRDIIGDADTAYEHLRAQSPDELDGFSEMIGNSPAMREAVGRAHRAAIRDVPVLLLGESGTGKTKIAQAIHAASARKNKPFCSINCAALPEALLESELFGYVKGAFTGATENKVGMFESADGGTLFLDEIGECNLSLQAKLLSVLQPLIEKGPCIRKLRRVGGKKDIEVDVRVIAATNRNLIQRVEDNQFRDDLYYRLAAITIKLPPIRQRGKDVETLAKHLLSEINDSFAKQDPEYDDRSLTPSALKFIREHRWPGNVRQLYNALLQAAVMTAKTKISAQDITSAIEEVPGQNTGSLLDHELGNDFELENLLASVQRHYIERALKQANGQKKKAAESLLGYNHWQTMDNHMKKLGIK